MACRLVLQIGDRTLRFPLGPGEHLVGSGADCAVVVRHPTVSRRHATVTLSGDRVTIADLGSRNGTRVDGRAISGPTELTPASEVRLGSVPLVLEEVAAGDLEAAVLLPGADRLPVREAPTDDGGSTVGPAILEAFALRQLPDLVARVARGDSRTEVAQAVGEAVLRTLPCARVEVVREGQNGTSVLFTAEQPGSGDTTTVAADVGEGYTLRVAFLSPRLAQSFEPLVWAAAGLVRAAGRTSEPAASRRPSPLSPPEPPSPPSLVTAVREAYAQAARVARGRVSVLVKGASGTGKELMARYIHTASDRAAAPLVTLNCAALPRDLLESELFGVEQGVATGVSARAGKFEAAHGGTLFLDEIGDMAPETQARILRVLQEGEVYRIGAHAPRPADARVISATNRDLDAMLSDGRFRRDLYHRIADWVVELPPLSERRPDIPNLAAHFLARACAERGVRAAGISRAAVEALQAYDWPGNVRQLEKEMSRAALFLEDGELLDTTRLQPMIATATPAASSQGTLREVRERAEREHVVRVLAECGGSVADAAERLDVGVSTLYARMKALGIE